MTFALIAISILLVVCLVYIACCLVALNRCDKAFKRMETANKLSINCLARIMDENQTAIYTKMLAVASTVSEEHDITDMELIDFDYLYAKFRTEMDSK